MIVIPNFVGAFQILAPWLAGAIVLSLLLVWWPWLVWPAKHV